MQFPNMAMARWWTILLILHLLSMQLIAGQDWNRPHDSYHLDKDTRFRHHQEPLNGYDPDFSRTTTVPPFTVNPPHDQHHFNKDARFRHYQKRPNSYDPDVSRTSTLMPRLPTNFPAPNPPDCPTVKKCSIVEQIIKINFTRTGLKAVGGGFIKNRNSIELQFNDNDIAEISPTAFHSLPKLQQLDLSGNNISTRKLLWFNNLDALQKLVIDGNRYRDEENAGLEDVLDPMPHLYQLSLKRNGINRFAVNLKTFAPMLTSLYVSGNRISSLDFLDNAPRTLSFLHADDNSISSVKGDHLASMEELSVSGNKIEELCGDGCEGNSLALHKATRLLRLNASRNEIGQVAEDAFTRTKHLSSLDLSSNKIAKLPIGLFEGLATIEELLLSRNQLTSIPNVCPLTYMKQLDLTGNQIVAIAKENFCSQPMSLETILLASNRISNIDGDAFADLRSLRKLDLSSNLILDFPARVIMVSQSLQTFLLRNNSIAKLEGLNAVSSNSLKELHLQENPLLHFKAAWIRFDSLPQLVIHLKDWSSRVEDDTKADADDTEADADDTKADEDEEIFGSSEWGSNTM